MKFYIIDWKNNQRKVSKKEVVLAIGSERLEKMISEGKVIHDDDPYVSIEYAIHGGRLVIEF
jgi:hypothetical protein